MRDKVIGAATTRPTELGRMESGKAITIMSASFDPKIRKFLPVRSDQEAGRSEIQDTEVSGY